MQVAACGAAELLIDGLPVGAKRQGALYPDGAHITNLKETRGLLYKMQRPGIAPNVCMSFVWCEPYTNVWPRSWSIRTIGKRQCCHG
jgi:xanthine dioxygenase